MFGMPDAYGHPKTLDEDNSTYNRPPGVMATGSNEMMQDFDYAMLQAMWNSDAYQNAETGFIVPEQ